MRGLFTAGVLDVLQEHDILVDGVVGVSAGALFGCNYISRQAGRALRYNLRFKDDPRYMGLRALLKTGNIVAPEFSYHTMPCELDVFDFDTFNNSPIEFHLVATDAEKGVPFYKKIDKMDDTGLEWMRASASMPIVSTPVELEGMKLLDGGVTDSIPLKYFQQQGFERNIVVLTQPKGYTKSRTKLMPARLSGDYKMHGPQAFDVQQSVGIHCRTGIHRQHHHHLPRTSFEDRSHGAKCRQDDVGARTGTHLRPAESAKN